jgi:hypothetical protein
VSRITLTMLFEGVSDVSTFTTRLPFKVKLPLTVSVPTPPLPGAMAAPLLTVRLLAIVPLPPSVPAVTIVGPMQALTPFK